MPVEIWKCNPKEMAGFIAEYLPAVGETEAEVIRASCIFSDPILGFFFDRELAALVGFVPTTIIPAKAYVWMQDGPALAKNRFRSAKLILRMREVMLNGRCERGLISHRREVFA